MKLSSTSFSSGGPIPVDYTGEGRDVSPALSWADAPTDTAEFALVCDDPDAPTAEPWVHWVVYKIPSTCHELSEGMGNRAATKLPGGLLQGLNSWTEGPNNCYRGPEPPRGHGVHHYHFRLYALRQPVELKAGASKQELLEAIEGHILATTELVGTYER